MKTNYVNLSPNAWQERACAYLQKCKTISLEIYQWCLEYMYIRAVYCIAKDNTDFNREKHYYQPIT